MKKYFSGVILEFLSLLILLFTVVVLIFATEWEYIAKKINDNQGVLSFIGLALACYGFLHWKRMHRCERKSNACIDFMRRILTLRFSILELRQPTFLPFKKEDEEKKRKYIDENLIPAIKEIGKMAIIIQREIHIHDEINRSGNSLTELINQMLKEVIYSIRGAIIEYNLGLGDDKVYEFFFPFENKDIKNKAITSDLSTNEIGMILIDDEFEKKINDTFESIVSELRKHII